LRGSVKPVSEVELKKKKKEEDEEEEEEEALHLSSYS